MTFLDLVQTVGLPWAVAFTVAVILARVIVVMWKDANKRTDDRIQDLKNQLEEMRQDRNFHRERGDRQYGTGEKALEAVSKLADRLDAQGQARGGGRAR